ncbi:glycosyltransferase [Phyllobacterium sp. 628]|uniref:glycosyltransferase family 2 protein n=1 Tax=Phyllobacterium sp. 628 TaxID=2718938 RepID=UPI0016624832|nr:glycosyltransferase family 2 protein [Phyllobacterium sp. 628]QND52707.1 glycosyltransferase [Phyllobacterium sp. 628]
MVTTKINATNPRKRRICVSTVTRNRPRMLEDLLQSYLELQVPQDIDLLFLIVENNEEATLDAIIDQFRQQTDRPVQYEIEPWLGIACARNHALECALAAGYDLLTFADDDEQVQSDWLIELLAERDRCDLDIVGSPVRCAPISSDAGFSARLVWAGLNRRNRRHELKASNRRAHNAAHTILLATGSWMGKLDFFRRTGLRFDNTLGLAGGEDWRLYREARKLGAKTGWTPHAIAYETVPLDRLTFRYHFRRDRDNSAVEICAKLASCRITTLLRLPGSLAGRVFKLCTYMMAAPFTRGEALLRVVACMGSIAGIFQGCLGKASSHYKRTTGS